MRGVLVNRHRTADTPNLAAQGQSVSRKTVAEVPLTGLSFVLEGPKNQRIAVEIKRSPTPKISKGFHFACDDVQATLKAVVHSGSESYSMQGNIEAFSLLDFLDTLDR